MKKLALALMAASAAVFGFGLVANAQSGYTPAVSNPTPTPGGSYTITYQNCFVGDLITFTQAQSTPVSGTAPCLGTVTLTGSVIGLLRPQQAPLGNATFTFTAAPTAPGNYTGTAGGGNSPQQTFAFTIPGQATTSTTAPTTTAAPTTTLAPTTTIAGGSPATTAAPTTAAPVTVPGTGLPATGSDGIGTTTGIALGLLVVGLGLFIVAQVRRRQAPAA